MLCVCRLHQGGWDRTQTGRVSPVFVCFVFVGFTREGVTEHRLVELVQCLCALCCRLHQGGWDRTQTGS